MKDYEINDAAVDRELDDAVEEAVSKAEHAIERIPLPLRAADLDAAASEHVVAASEFYHLGLAGTPRRFQNGIAAPSPPRSSLQSLRDVREVSLG